MFNKIKQALTHESTQKAIFLAIINTRRATKYTKDNTTQLIKDTKDTWNIAMNVVIS